MGDSTRPVALWRDRTFRFIWGGQTASLFGDQVTNLALPWLLLHQTHSAFVAGAVSAARYLPLLLFGLAAGLIADRVERRALMIAADVGRLVALGAVALVGVLGRVPPLWLLVLVVLALGTGQLLFGVAYGAWLPDVTGDERLGQANAALESSDAASVLAGGPLGGALITAIGPVLALGADALSYGVSAATLMRVRTERPVGQPSSGDATGDTRAPGVWAEATAGVRAILALPAQRLIKGAATALHMDAGAIGVLLATLTQLRLHLPAWQAGLVFGAAGVGGLIASAVAPRLYDRGWQRGVAVALAIAALGSAGLAGASLLDRGPGFVVALIANAVLDGAVALGFVLATTASTLVTPRALRGRVNAASTIYASLVRGAAAVGLGALAGMGDPLPAFVVLAACCACAAIVTSRVHLDAGGES